MSVYGKAALVLLIWNIITFIVMWIDKRNAIKEKRRIKESTLMLLAFAMGGPGVLAGMLAFHHKTRKPLFFLGVPAAIAVNILAVVGFWQLLSSMD